MKDKIIKYFAVSAATIVVTIGIGGFIYYKLFRKNKKEDKKGEKTLLLHLLKQRQQCLFAIANYFSYLYQSNSEGDSLPLNPKDRLVLFNMKSKH